MSTRKRLMELVPAVKPLVMEPKPRALVRVILGDYIQDRDGKWWTRHVKFGWTRVDERNSHFRYHLTRHTRLSLLTRRSGYFDTVEYGKLPPGWWEVRGLERWFCTALHHVVFE